MSWPVALHTQNAVVVAAQSETAVKYLECVLRVRDKAVCLCETVQVSDRKS